MNLKKFFTIDADALLLRRLLYVGVILVCIVATFVLLLAQDRAAATARDAAVRAAWLSGAVPAAGLATPDAVYSRFNIKAVANADMTWHAASMADVRASLRALELAQVKLTQVKLARSGAGFTVSAERAQ